MWREVKARAEWFVAWQALAAMAVVQPRAVDDSMRKATLLAIMEDIQQVPHRCSQLDEFGLALLHRLLQDMDQKPRAINYVEWACRELGIDPEETCGGRLVARQRAVGGERDDEEEEEEELGFEEMLSDAKGKGEGAAASK